MTDSIFLSASVPLPDRNPHYFETGDNVAIRESVRALISVAVPTMRIVFGGHPAITPLVRLIIRGKRVSVREHVTLYQSDFFFGEMPNEVDEFEKLVVVPGVVGNREQSLRNMRVAMLTQSRYRAAVFIGGMEGVEEEYQMFRQYHPDVPTFPIASTGAAAKLLYEQRIDRDPRLQNELSYVTLFRDLLNIPQM